METFTLVVDIITAFGVIVALFSLSVSMRSAYLSTIAKCTEEFRELVRKEQILCEMQSQHPDTDAHLLILKRDFLGLFNEQLFYIRKGYAPKDISMEWLDTMIQYMYAKPHNDHAGLTIDRNKDLADFNRLDHFCRFYEKWEANTNGKKGLSNIIYRKYYDGNKMVKCVYGLFPPLVSSKSKN